LMASVPFLWFWFDRFLNVRNKYFPPHHSVDAASKIVSIVFPKKNLKRQWKYIFVECLWCCRLFLYIHVLLHYPPGNIPISKEIDFDFVKLL
jgi:hypothetical protein